MTEFRLFSTLNMSSSNSYDCLAITIIQFISESQETLQAGVNEVTLTLQWQRLQRPASTSAVNAENICKYDFTSICSLKFYVRGIQLAYV